jgi:undecaprenyl-diphosphatase
MPELLIVLILGIIEGVTEFLPVSSTGHMVLCEWGMRLNLHDPFWTLFTVFIQIGAILAVLVYFRQKIMHMLLGAPVSAGAAVEAVAAGVPTAPPTGANGFVEQSLPPRRRPDYRMLWLIAVGTVPVLIVGFLTHKWVEANLQNPMVIVAALGIGGVIMIAIEKLPLMVRAARMEEMSFRQALIVGLAQILAAVFPGTSRSAATIMGGMAAGMSREAATEFSFFLAIPAMFAACGSELLKHLHHLSMDQALLLTIGTLVAFLVAWVVIAAFMRYIRRHDFVPFGIYRILLAIVVMAMYFTMGG